ncbi:hypothetical protein SAMN04488137_4600 [Fictibacillus solisalsi]|uniref:Tetratricopeptide repeat-containing protein n=1 Tax=Fictibacillus solisalsi TaxID=459525 RepID=A0A1H0BPQ2_9BACL|nr:hypothetical protein [Fictibacillus solisalsi]SDN47562.1 hypothetical protein SAMN04488137_4600 [Fictibacillus solisalsi]
MKKILIVLSVIGIIAFAITSFRSYNFYKAYEIPSLKGNVNIHELNIDFKEEIKIANRNIAENRELGVKDINEVNVEEGYHYSKKLIKEGKYNQASQLLKKIVKLKPNQWVYLNELRILALKENKTDDFLKTMEAIPQTYEVRMNEALAYVDYLQTPGMGTANLGQKSAQSINLLNEIIKENKHDLLAHYARGLNNLYWPLGLKRTNKAIQDLTYCVAVEKEFGGDKFPFWALFYVALGDALVKDGQQKEGQAVWKQGYKKYPHSSELEKRQGLDEKKAFQLVKEERGIDGFQQPDKSISDLSIIWSNH